MAMESMQDLYVETIKDLYSAEQQIIKALPKMIKHASHAALRSGFERHLEQTKEHARRLEGIAERMGKKPGGKTCAGMKGLIEEGEEAIKEAANPSVLDAAMIAAAQRIEHYEMAGYGCARTYAQYLGLDEDINALQTTLDEEAETDKKLTQVAESVVNPDAERQLDVSRESDSARGDRSSRSRGDSEMRAEG